MKMIAKGAALILFVFLIAGCMGDENEIYRPVYGAESVGKELAGTLQAMELSEESNRLVSSLGIDSVHVFDISNDSGSDTIFIRYWAEVYKEGKRQSDGMNFSWELGEKGHWIISSDSIDDSKFMYLRAVMENNQNVMTGTEGKIKLSSKKTTQSLNTIPAEVKLYFNEPITLMTYARDDGQVDVSIEALDFYDETGEMLDAIKKYDEVILLRIVAESQPFPQ